MEKNDPRMSSWNTIETRLSGKVVSKTSQVRISSACSNFKPHKGMYSKSEMSNFKLLFHPIGQDRSGPNKSVRDKELISKKAEHLSITFGQYISTTDDPFIQSVNNRVLANSIRIC